ncbi:MAG TPA: hypothetical protein VE422_02055 [Terriglobia bacterium]|nr:hypothetical protein [Terriglobia bacterium]
MSKHEMLPSHDHEHGENCGHTRVQHNDHTDYVHDGHLHSKHGDHYDEHVIEVSSSNPADCKPIECQGNHNSAHPRIPHGDHVDFLYNGRLHRSHGGHCDDHGKLRAA